MNAPALLLLWCLFLLWGCGSSRGCTPLLFLVFLRLACGRSRNQHWRQYDAAMCVKHKMEATRHAGEKGKTLTTASPRNIFTSQLLHTKVGGQGRTLEIFSMHKCLLALCTLVPASPPPLPTALRPTAIVTFTTTHGHAHRRTRSHRKPWGHHGAPTLYAALILRRSWTAAATAGSLAAFKSRTLSPWVACCARSSSAVAILVE
jgi:hypothetical protein